MLLQTCAILSFMAVSSTSPAFPSSGVQMQDLSISKQELPWFGAGIPFSRCNHTLCGGVANVMEVSIDCGGFDCGGFVCSGRCPSDVAPGDVCSIGIGFIPSNPASSLTLSAEICMPSGFCMQIFEAVLPNSSTLPGFGYTIRFSLVTDDILAGQEVVSRVLIVNNLNLQVEVCLEYPLLVQSVLK